MEELRIRIAKRSDLKEIVEVENFCFPKETSFPPGMFEFLIDNAISLVARKMTPAGSEGPLLGFIIGYPSGRTGIIYTLDVHPSCRRQGIGRALIQSIEEKLRSSGARTCRLEAASANPAALCLYKGEGYKEGELIRDYYGNGCHAVRCWKDLDG